MIKNQWYLELRSWAFNKNEIFPLRFAAFSIIENSTQYNTHAIEQAQQHLHRDADAEAGLEEVVVNLYEQTDMEIAQIAAMVNRDKSFVLEVLMNRRLMLLYILNPSTNASPLPHNLH